MQESDLLEYVKKHKPCISIFTISVDGTTPVEYTNSLISTMQLCSQYNIGIHVEFHKQHNNILYGKNQFLSKCAMDKEITHIMFIDKSMVWNPVDIIHLLLSDKHIVSGAPPHPHYFWDQLENNPSLVQQMIDNQKEKELLRNMTFSTICQSRLLKYNVNIGTTDLNIVENMLEVKHVSFHFIMMQKTVIEKMIEAFPSTKYNEKYYCLLDNAVENETFYSDEEVFLNRWFHMKGKLFVNMNMKLDCVQNNVFQGSFLASMMT